MDVTGKPAPLAAGDGSRQIPRAGVRAADETDRVLLHQLGLRPDGHQRERTALGIVSCAGCSVSVQVSALPALFWVFTIDRPGADHLMQIETGSGRFGDYWPLVLRLLNGEPHEPVVRAAEEDCSGIQIMRLGR